MELNRESLDTMETVCDAQLEIPVETEIALADYLPHVFKIVKCLATTVVLQKQAGTSRLMLEGYIRCEVFYQSDENGGISQAEQKVPFTKYADMRENSCNVVQMDADGDTVYLNARAASENRIVLRGACMLHVKAIGVAATNLLYGTAEENVFCKTDAITANYLLAQQEKMVVAEAPLTFARPPKAVLHVQMHIQKEDVRVSANRTIYTGALVLNAVCTDENGQILQAQANYLLNEAIMFESLQEDDLVGAYITPLGCTVQERQQEKGTGEIIASANLLLCVYVYRKKKQTILLDVFSSENKLEIIQKPFSYTALMQQMTQTVTDVQELTLPATAASLLFAVAKATRPELVNGEVCGKVTICAFCQTENEGIEVCEGSGNYSLPISCDADILQQSSAFVTDMRAEMNGNTLRVQTEVALSGVLLKYMAKSIVNDVQVTEKWEPQTAVPLYIYYPDEHETMFDIAKKYHVSPQVISELNAEYNTENTSIPMLIPGIRE